VRSAASKNNSEDSPLSFFPFPFLFPLKQKTCSPLDLIYRHNKLSWQPYKPKITISSNMRIRKNAKLSSLVFSHGSGAQPLQTHVCQLNQSPWDVISFSQETYYPSSSLSQVSFHYGMSLFVSFIFLLVLTDLSKPFLYLSSLYLHFFFFFFFLGFF
jgi:hypothetical protein